MNYYPFHIGDYATHTAHLEPMEDLAYRRLLDLYYLREGCLPSDPAECARLIRMRTEVEMVASVLAEFFEDTPDGWYSDRCDKEVSRMLDKQAKAQASAQASVNARRANAQRTLNERSTDVELPTPTPIPTPEEKNTGASAKRAKHAAMRPDSVDEKVWGDFVAMRKAKRSPLTQTALDGIEREATKAGIALGDALAMCCARGWQGFKADWVRDKVAPIQATGETPYQRTMRERAAEWSPSIARSAPIQTRNVGDVFDAEVLTTQTKRLGVA